MTLNKVARTAMATDGPLGKDGAVDKLEMICGRHFSGDLLERIRLMRRL